MDSLVNLIARDLFLPPRDLRALIRSAPMRYKVYSIPKRSGKGCVQSLSLHRRLKSFNGGL